MISSKIRGLIEQLESCKKKEHVDWYGAISSEKIAELEGKLGVQLPPSFKEFLEICGGGGVVDSPISGVEDNDPSLDTGGTVLGSTLMVREEYNLPSTLVVILFEEDEVCWCLDTEQADESGECPVVSYSLFTGNIDGKIAGSFSDFLEEYVRLECSG